MTHKCQDYLHDFANISIYQPHEATGHSRSSKAVALKNLSEFNKQGLVLLPPQQK